MIFPLLMILCCGFSFDMLLLAGAMFVGQIVFFLLAIPIMIIGMIIGNMYVKWHFANVRKGN